MIVTIATTNKVAFNPTFIHNMCMMITEQHIDERSMYLHYTIENIQNNLKMIESEVELTNWNWNSIQKQLEQIDNQVDKLANRVKWK